MAQGVLIVKDKLQEAAHEIFRASGDGVGPLALRILRKGRAGLGIVVVEVMGTMTQVKPPDGMFFTLVDRLDILDENVFVDFADVEALIAHPWRLAREGAARCKELRMGNEDPVGDDLLELLVDAFVWYQTCREQRVPTATELLAQAAARQAPVGLDLPAILQASVFQRLGKVHPLARQFGAVRTFFQHLAVDLADEDHRWRESFAEEHKRLNAQMRDVEREVSALRQTLATLDGGSHHPDHPYYSNQFGLLSGKLERLRRAESKAQGDIGVAMQRARGEARSRLYPSGPVEHEAPPAA
ncbi:MAG: hypothetical protein MUF64_11185 [Polyangiaceae bacterium]|nr:hypothetical protein [Polyangiaceae bacterium]